MPKARAFTRAGRGKSASPVRRGERHLLVLSYSTGSVGMLMIVPDRSGLGHRGGSDARTRLFCVHVEAEHRGYFALAPPAHGPLDAHAPDVGARNQIEQDGIKTAVEFRRERGDRP